MSTQKARPLFVKQSPIPIRKIITHHWPHLDEIAAIMLLKRHGEGTFPGVATAKVEYLTTGDALVLGKTPEEHEAEGTLLVGIGGGRFDEHPSQGVNRKTGECACSLVAKYLKRDGDPVWGKVIERVTEADLSGVHPMHIATELKRRYRQNPKNPQDVIGFGRDCINSILQEQELFHEARRIVTTGNVRASYTVKRGGGKEKIRIVGVESDNTEFAAAARSAGVGILVQRNSRGHVCVMTDNRLAIDLSLIVSRIRSAELRTEDPNVVMDDAELDTLYNPGKHPRVPHWYYQVPGQNALNGSETTPDTKPTRMSLEMILAIVCGAVEESDMRLQQQM